SAAGSQPDFLGAFAQLVFLDLAGRGLWQRPENYGPRHLVIGEVSAAPGDDVLGRDRTAFRSEGHEGTRRLSPHRVGSSNDRRFHNFGVAIKDLLDFER